MIPNRYSVENEIQTELCNSAIGLLSSFHDFMWLRTAHKLKIEGEISTLCTEGVLKQLRNTPNIFGERLKRISALTIISNFQLLAELAAIHVTDKTSSSFFIRNLKWLVVLLIECTKLVIRLTMFIENPAILNHPKFPSRSASFELPQPADQWTVDGIPIPTGPDGEERITLRSATKRFKEEWLKNRTLNEIPASLSVGIAIGELLWIFRPLVYLFLLFLFGKTSLVPSLVTLSMDVLSRKCQEGRIKDMNSSEVDELNRRRFTWLLYLLKPPGPISWIFPRSENTKSSEVPTSAFAGFLQSVPGMLEVFQNRYFYTAY